MKTKLQVLAKRMGWTVAVLLWLGLAGSGAPRAHGYVINGGWGWDYPCDWLDPDECPGYCPDPGDEEDTSTGEGALEAATLRGGNCSHCGHHHWWPFPIQPTPPAPFLGPVAAQAHGALGMPVWLVREPAVSLWLRDTPLAYRPSRGQPIRFRLLFKSELDTQLSAELQRTDLFSVGDHWVTPWRSYLRALDDNGGYYWFNGLGGTVAMTNGDAAEYKTRVRSGSESGTPVLYYTSGGKDVFGYDYENGGVHRYFLSEKQDRFGNKTTFQYVVEAGVLRLVRVIDVDNRTNTLGYDTVNGYMVLTGVTNPCGYTALLGYDSATGGNRPPSLTNLVDAAGLTNTVEYSGSTLSKLHTPYGTTEFTLLTTSGGAKAVRVTELGVRNHLYLQLFEETEGKVTNSYAAWRPATTNDGAGSFPNTLDAEDSHKRNTFYWGPRQFDLLPSAFVASLAPGASPALDLSQLAATNYLQARQRHWLEKTNGVTANQGETLSLERAPSPDGVAQGRITWYDYGGKPPGYISVEGEMALPRFTAWKLPNGESRFLRHERNSYGHPTQVIETYSDAAGNLRVRTNTFVYASNLVDLLAVTNALGVRTVSNVFNSYHQATTNYNALNERTVFTYDSNHRLTSTTSPGGQVTTNVYGGDGFLAQQIVVGVSTNTLTWTNGLVRTYTSERGLTVTNTWDGLNRPLRQDYPASAGGGSIARVYDKLDLVVATDRLGHSNRWVYDGFRQMTQAVDALNRTNAYTYCTCGALESGTDAMGQTTTFYTDLAGRLERTYSPDGLWHTNWYDAMGRLLAGADNSQAVVTNTYNNQGLVVAVSNAFGRMSSVTYDVLDRATNLVNANGVTITNTFDELGRLLTRGYPDGGVEHFGYTANMAGLTTYTNQLGTNVMTLAYDPLGRLTNVVYPTVATNAFFYDVSGLLTNLVDGNGQRTWWAYNEFGLLTNKVEDTGQTVFRYAYDLNGRLTNRWTPEKGTTVYRFDPVGNLTNVAYPLNASLALQYDALNRLTNLVDRMGTTRYRYTAAGALWSEDGPWDSDTVSYSYTSRMRTGLSVEQPNASPWTVSYAYDAIKRLTNITSPAGAFGYQYPASSPQHLVASLTLPGGAYITNEFDNLARLTSTILRNNRDTHLNVHAYTYDLASQRTRQTFLAGNTVDYTYDPIGQLKTAFGKESGGSPSRLHEQLSYVYDAAGNLSWRTNNALAEQFKVNTLNELTNLARTAGSTLTVAGTTTSAATNVTVNNQTATLYGDAAFARAGFSLCDGTNAFTAVARDSYGRVDTNTVTTYLPAAATLRYDANGNLTNDARRVFRYDDENQLVQVLVTNATGPVTRSDFGYDSLGRRRVRWESTLAGGNWVTNLMVRYVYDGLLVMQERHFAPQLSTTVPHELVTYTRGRDLSGSLDGAGGIGGLLARTASSSIQNPVSSYYHCDGNGNTTCLINSNQIVVARYHYDPFGSTLSLSGSMAEANRYRFSSKEWHQPSELVYYIYRYYSPSLQRWLNRDPLEEKGGFNLYAMVKNDPVDYSDALGDSPTDWDEESRAARNAGRPGHGKDARGSTHDDHTAADGHGGSRGKPNMAGPPLTRRQRELILQQKIAEGSIIDPNLPMKDKGVKIKGGSMKCLGPIGCLLQLIHGVIEDLERWYRAVDNGTSYMDQLKEDVGDYPTLDTPLGPMANPWYCPLAWTISPVYTPENGDSVEDSTSSSWKPKAGVLDRCKQESWEMYSAYIIKIVWFYAEVAVSVTEDGGRG